MNIIKMMLPAVALAATGVNAQQSTIDPAALGFPVTSAPTPVEADVWTLPPNTELTVTPNSEVSSKTMRKGDIFSISTVYDVQMNNFIVIPKGTRGQGKVTWRTGKGAFGKSAKMDLALEWIELGGRRIAIEGKHRQEGSGNTAATLGTVLAVGPFAGFVTGKSATIPNGMQIKAFTAEPVQFRARALRPVPVSAAIVAAGPAISQGTSPSVIPVSSSDSAQ